MSIMPRQQWLARCRDRGRHKFVSKERSDKVTTLGADVSLGQAGRRSIIAGGISSPAAPACGYHEITAPAMGGGRGKGRIEIDR